jgi:hypothetical protein
VYTGPTATYTLTTDQRLVAQRLTTFLGAYLSNGC